MKRRTFTIGSATRPEGAGFANSAPRFEDIARPLPELVGAGEATTLDGLGRAELDDATAAYVLAMRDPFELLRRAAAQLAGLMVLVASGARNVAAHPMLDLALEAQAEADELIGSRSSLVPERASHHRLHLLRGNRALAEALAAARRDVSRNDPETIDRIMAPLRAAYRELQWAALALPGFEIVALSQGCCAAHAGARTNNHQG